MRRAIAGALALLLSSGCGGAEPAPRSVPDRGAGEVRSNVFRADYAGSAACVPCHGDLHARFVGSPMHRMTRDAARTDIAAPFDGELELGGDRVTMERRGDGRFMRMHAGTDDERLFRVTKVIGGRYREDFAGVAVVSTEASAPRGGTELILPASWVIGTSEWRYKGYSVMTPERPHLDAGPSWRGTCIFCHNTPPALSLLLDDLYGDGAPSYQGRAHDRLLPESRRTRWEVTDAAAVAREVEAEVERLGGVTPATADLPGWLLSAIDATGARFDAGDLVELGIGCEACHGGAREHVADPEVLPSYRPRGRGVEARSPRDGATEAEWIVRTCLRCHTVLFSGYPFTWEGGDREASPGGSHINSGEARDLLLGGCSPELSCTSCHDPHVEDERTRLDALSSPAGNTVCTGCHRELGGDDALRAHAHHDPQGEGGACIACHMPRKNMGLGYDLTAYHRIGSPSDPVRVERDRPLECALCHVDRSVESLVGSMEQWWGERYDRDRLRTLYGDDLQIRPLEATLARGRSHERAVAAAVLGRRGTREAIPAIVPVLEDDIPLVRYFAREAIARLSAER